MNGVANKDKKLIEGIKTKSERLIPKYISELVTKSDIELNHPLDKGIISSLSKINIRDDDDDFIIFQYLKEINALWKQIIENSIKCLRYFDTREPFLKINSKKPIAYGVNELGKYFDKYSEFESMLYGGAKYYRDHVVHVFRTWLLGIDCLLENDGKYLEKISIGENVKVNSLEKLSIWSMIALTHDLGYPLEKSQEIIDKTKDMMKSFIINPVVSMDLSFNGVQNNMNDFVIRFLSSKMHEKPEKPGEYVARLQPKYYFKFQKSLERSKHGILSAIIIYKLLLYFLESDYSLNEDYIFKEEDVRQYYIRREILRSISSHTCHDIYHLDMLTFSFLLIIVDDCQEWGRKKISELYIKNDTNYEFDEIIPNFDIKKVEIDGKEVQMHKCTISEKFDIPQKDSNGLERILIELLNQNDSYREIFRDGQDTSRRNFTFIKKCEVTYDDERKVTFDVEFIISNEKNSSFEITVKKTGTKSVNDKYSIEFMKRIYGKCNVIEQENTDQKISFSIQDCNISV